MLNLGLNERKTVARMDARENVDGGEMPTARVHAFAPVRCAELKHCGCEAE
jgi:hypothetical protein